MGIPITSLRIGDRVIARCDDGLLAAEYALFEPHEVVLHAPGPTAVFETGYLTTAGDALAHLANSGVSIDLAAEAAAALDREVAATYARGAAVRATLGHLCAHELFEGAIYRVATQLYDGAWLDLRALATALRMPGAVLALQTVHLAEALNEVPRATPVMLSTWTGTTEPRPGARTFRRVPLDDVIHLPRALESLQPRRAPPALDAVMEHELRDALLRTVRWRARSEVPPAVRARLESLEAMIGSDAPRRGPLADPELWAIEKQLARGQTAGIELRLDALAHQLGNNAGIRYLRARAQLLRGDIAPRHVAERLAEIADGEASFYEADVLAARAWLAAGEDAHARYFARRVAEDADAPDGIKLLSLEILESTTMTKRSYAPPPVAPRDPAPAAMAGSPPGSSRQLFVSSGSRAAPFDSTAMPMPMPHLPGTMRMPAASAPAAPVAPSPPPPPPALGQAPSASVASGPRYVSELAETLPFPAGTDESSLRAHAAPSTPIEARVFATRLARELGRVYRLWYGTTLRTDVMAIDTMQRHLRMRFADDSALADPRVVADLRRHGALLSEIIARNLGGVWVDLSAPEPGYWEMLVPPGMRLWPVGRLFRYVQVGQREQDLVSFYFELEDHWRRGQVGP